MTLDSCCCGATGDHALIQVAARFCGPPGSANGGYICGLVAGHIDQPVTVRLLRSPPLETAFELHAVEPGLWAVEAAGLRYIEARATAPLELAIPASPGYLQAQESSLHGPHDPREHPCPGCFVCGPERARGDGLRIFAGPVPDRDFVAAAWVPDASLARGDGQVPPEVLSAALDCPGFHALRTGARPWLLGEFTTHVDKLVRAGERCVIVGWTIDGQGRKQTVGTALFDENGTVCAWARGIWIEPRVAPPAAP
jgi:hypothetical protein